MKTLAFSLTLILSLSSFACNDGVSRYNSPKKDADAVGTPKPGDPKNPTNPGDPIDPNVPGSNLVCVGNGDAMSYTGLGDVKLKVGASDSDGASKNRYRLKSFDLLQASIKEIAGVVPASASGFSATFNAPPARWYAMPTPSVLTNYATFVISYDAAQAILKADKSWVARTTPDQIKEGCRNFALSAWHQTPSDTVIAACAAYISSPELSKLSANDRWAYGLASILSSIDFIAF